MLGVHDLRASPQRLAPTSVAMDPDVVTAVRDIVSRVRSRGDAALFELTERYDGPDLRSTGMVASPGEIGAGRLETPAELRVAIDAMIERLRELHARQLPAEWCAGTDGLRYGEIVRPIRRVGCYVPGGRAAYPSTVAMTVVPARVAGVEEIVVCTPPRPDGSLPAAVRYAAERAGATEVVKLGGAQAVAALAYGTESVAPVDKVVGPGNVFVTAAKREVVGAVGVDALAGPTELVVVADETADPAFLAADLVAQAEHDPLARATVVTTAECLVARLDDALRAELAGAGRREIVAAALEQARVVLVADEAGAAEVVNDLAPEHLQVLLAEPRAFVPRVGNAGAIFLGPWSPVPFGDYGVGSNHVLPTMGTARFHGGLRAADFVTVSSVVEGSPQAVLRFASEIATIARSEGLVGHGRAAEVRADRVAAQGPR